MLALEYTESLETQLCSQLRLIIIVLKVQLLRQIQLATQNPYKKNWLNFHRYALFPMGSDGTSNYLDTDWMIMTGEEHNIS